MNKTDKLISAIRETASNIGDVTFMEVCGTHTHEIHRFGIPQALPSNVHLVSGPGCPVCVTDESDIHNAIEIASQDDVIFCCFGDMLRVPCNGKSLYSLKSKGKDIRIVNSPLDSLSIALANRNKQIVYFGVGFETTTPHTAALLEKIVSLKIDNILILPVHKRMPEAIRAVLNCDSKIDGLICPGHVSVVTGSDLFDFIPHEFDIPAVISGFSAEEILTSIYLLCRMCKMNVAKCINAYPEAVRSAPNTEAEKIVDKYFVIGDSLWRGLGLIKNSGLILKNDFRCYDALNHFDLPEFVNSGNSLCRCGDIIRSTALPMDCPCFGVTCTPDNPLGPCMISSEGTCSSYFNYR